jgi:lipopolysaccharide transport system ATP-binding protein
MSNVAIRVDDLSKRYRLPDTNGATYKTMRDSVANMFQKRAPTDRAKADRIFWALRDISFEIKPGEVVGLIGRNGAGKSTLLKVLAQITEPTAGHATLHGRVGSLLEVGTGFHPELSGRENIFLNGAILGMSRAEIVRKMDEIIAFAEVERFIDSPVKFYSSGMFVRLAFAVAAHLEPEILFVDEVLAVGDAAFQKKCLGRMGEVARSGRTVVLVSHNMGAISELCTHGLLLDGGRLEKSGDIEDIVMEYGRRMKARGVTATLEDTGKDFTFLEAAVLDAKGEVAETFDLHDEIEVVLTYRLRKPLEGLVIVLTLARNFNDVFHTYDTDGLEAIPTRAPGVYTSRMRIPRHFLKAGHYSITVNSGIPACLLAMHEDLISFDIEELTENTHSRGYRSDRLGQVIAPVTWAIQKQE